MGLFDLLAVQGLSRVFSNITVQKHQFFGAQLLSSKTGKTNFGVVRSQNADYLWWESLLAGKGHGKVFGGDVVLKEILT